MKLKLDISPDLASLMAAEIVAGERAVTTAVREAGAGLKLAWAKAGRSSAPGSGRGWPTRSGRRSSRRPAPA